MYSHKPQKPSHTHSGESGLTRRYVTFTLAHTGLIEPSVTTDGSETCRCLCMLLLSAVNKDLLFFIIESYDWCEAHEARRRAHMTIRQRFCFLFFLFQPFTHTDPFATGGLSIRYVGQPGALLVVQKSVCRCVCQTERHFQPVYTVFSRLRLFLF